MNAWQHGPGVVVPTSVVLARCGPAATSQLSLPASVGSSLDADITTGYVETLIRHCSHSFHYGTASHLVLVGDMEWYQGILPQTLITLLSKFIVTCREVTSMGNEGTVQFTAGSFLTGGAEPGFDANVLRVEVRPNDPIELCHRTIATLSSAAQAKRIAWIRACIPSFSGCEISCTFLVPPPIEVMSWEVHHYLRQVDDDLLLSRNALTMFVWHTSAVISALSQLPASGEIFITMTKQKERLCAAIPNTPAAKFLLQDVDGKNGSVRRQRESQSTAAAAQNMMHGPPSNAKPTGTTSEMQAMEAEMGALRAACLQLTAANQQLTHDLSQLKQVTAQQQQMHQALLAGAVQPPVRGGAGLLLPPLDHRDGNKGALVVQGSNRPRAMPNGGMDINVERIQALVADMAELSHSIQSAIPHAAAQDLMKGVLVWREQESSVLHACLSAVLCAVGRELPPSLSAATSVGHVSVGPSTGNDPLTSMYRHRLQEMERELVRLTEFDVEGLASQFYTEELQRMEEEIASWMTKYHMAV